MDWSQFICGLLTLLMTFGYSISYSTPPTTHHHASTCFSSDLDYKIQGVHFMTVTRRLGTLSLYPNIRRGKIHTLLYISLLLIAISSDVEQNPGPRSPKYPCGICDRAVKWEQRGVACDDCQQWYHTDCMHMRTHTYDILANHSNLSWLCDNCGLPNFATSLFESFIVDSSENSFSILNSTASSISSPGPPISSSSPIASRKKHTTPSFRSMKILTVNFQSVKNKKAELGNLIESSDPNIIIGTETWLNPSIHSSEIFPPNYDIIRKDRYDGYGGVLLAIKNDLIYEKIDTDGNTESVFAKITLDKNKPLIVGSVYRPPSSDQKYTEDLCLEIDHLKKSFKNAVMWIGGDLNVPDINWASNTVEGNQNSSRINNMILDLTESCDLQQMVTEPTRKNNILDLFLTNRPTLITRCTTIPGLGDHDIVFVMSSASAKRTKPVKRQIHLWKKADTESLKASCLSFQDEFLQKYTNYSDVNQMWEDIKKHLLDMLDACVPSKMTSSRFSQPWINREVKQLSRRKKRAFSKARKSKKPKDKRRYEHLKKLSKEACDTAYNDYMTNIISPESSSNPKRFWGFIKSKKNDNHGVAPLKAKTGITHSDSATKANILNEQFSSVFNKDESTASIPDMGPSPHPPVNNITVTTEGVRKLLAGVKPHKATGPDNLPARLLKELSLELAPIYTLLFQASLDQGIVPTDWKSANVVPIFKKGDQSKAENYRPVSLTSITCKTLEHIVSSSIMTHMDRHSIITDAQHGFRKRRSCETQLLITIQDLASTVDTMGQTDVILLDFSKAFDKVPHQRLLSKLHYYGVRSNMHSWISSFLEDRTQQVNLDGSTSSQVPVQSGVPQGSVLGPLLFLLYINDLPSYISPKSTARLFADDCVLYRRINSEEDAHALQTDLDGLQRWENEWLMEFHPQKCQVIHVTKKRKIVDQPYNIHGHTLQEVDSAKYLGLNIHKTLNWNQHINTVTTKANNARSFLQRNIQQCPRKTKELCYTTLVRPLMEYATIVWDPFTDANIRKLEMVQRRAARMIFSDYRRTSSVTPMLQQLQWPTLQERRAQAKVTMMYRIVHSQVDVPTIYLTPISSVRGHGFNYLVPFARTLCYQRSFFPDSIRLWNSLPETVVSCTNIDSFKREVLEVNLR